METDLLVTRFKVLHRLMTPKEAVAEYQRRRTEFMRWIAVSFLAIACFAQAQ